jgi:hypothetical protein
MLAIRDRLQAIEDQLMAPGFDEFAVATDAGTLPGARWSGRGRSMARSRRRLGMRSGDDSPPRACVIANLFTFDLDEPRCGS